MSQYQKFIEIEQFPEDARPGLVDYLCQLCGGIYNDPLMGSCPHVFCRTCFVTTLNTSKACPLCLKVSDPNNLHPVTFIQSKILDKYVITCRNDCGWNGKPSTYSNHIQNECENVTIKCPNTGCPESFTRGEAVNHENTCKHKPIACTYCEEKVPEVKMSQHLETCPKVMLDCPQQCGYLLERKELEAHVNSTCENANIDCLFKEIGCSSKLPRKEMTDHMQKNLISHNEMMMKTFTELKERIADLEESGVFKENLDNCRAELRSTSKGDFNEDHNTLNSINGMKNITPR